MHCCAVLCYAPLSALRYTAQATTNACVGEVPSLHHCAGLAGHTCNPVCTNGLDQNHDLAAIAAGTPSAPPHSAAAHTHSHVHTGTRRPAVHCFAANPAELAEPPHLPQPLPWRPPPALPALALRELLYRRPKEAGTILPIDCLDCSTQPVGHCVHTQDALQHTMPYLHAYATLQQHEARARPRGARSASYLVLASFNDVGHPSCRRRG